MLGKDTYGGLISPPVFNRGIDKINLDLTEQYIQIVDQNQNITDDIRQFVKTLGDNLYAPLDINTYGYGELPSDYVRYIDAAYSLFYNDNCSTVAKRVPIEMLSRGHFQQRLRAGMYYPTAAKPIATIQNERILIRPQGVTQIEFTYFRTPATPYFDYDIVTASGQPIYLPPGYVHGEIPDTTVNPDFTAGDPSLSVEFEWDVPLETSILNNLASYMRMNIKDNMPPVEYKIDQPPVA